MWLTTFVPFDSIKFELICSFDKHAVNFMISAPVAEHQLLVFLVGRYNRTSQTQLNLIISVVDLNLGQNCLDMGGLVNSRGDL
jgi:hypothetical protein